MEFETGFGGGWPWTLSAGWAEITVARQRFGLHSKPLLTCGRRVKQPRLRNPYLKSRPLSCKLFDQFPHNVKYGSNPVVAQQGSLR